MRRRPALVAAICVLGATAPPAAAGGVTPGVTVPALIGLNWPDTRPPVVRGEALEAAFRPLVTATETAELSITDPVGLTPSTRGRLRFDGRALGSPLLVLLSGEPRGTLDAPGAASLLAYPGGGVTGRPADITLRARARPSRTPDDLQVVISVTAGP